MSNPKQAAFESLQRFTMQLRGLAEIAPDLQNVASLEQATAEAQKRLDGVKAQHAAEQKAHDDKLAALNTAAEKVASNKRAEAETALIQAKANAAAIETQANDKARQIVADAQDKAAKIEAELADQNAAVEKAKSDLVVLDVDIQRQKAALADLNGNIAETSAKRDRAAAEHKKFLASIGAA